MKKNYHGTFRIIDYLISHKQLLLGSDDSAIYFLFQGVSEMKIMDYFKNPSIELIGKKASSRHQLGVPEILNQYEISGENFVGYILANSFQAYYQEVGFMALRIDSLFDGKVKLLDEF
jgi:hypothetical protein